MNAATYVNRFIRYYFRCWAVRIRNGRYVKPVGTVYGYGGISSPVRPPYTSTGEHVVLGSYAPCRFCMELAFKAAQSAQAMPIGEDRHRWQTYAAEMFLYSFGHMTGGCQNRIRMI